MKLNCASVILCAMKNQLIIKHRCCQVLAFDIFQCVQICIDCWRVVQIGIDSTHTYTYVSKICVLTNSACNLHWQTKRGGTSQDSIGRQSIIWLYINVHRPINYQHHLFMPQLWLRQLQHPAYCQWSQKFHLRVLRALAYLSASKGMSLPYLNHHHMDVWTIHHSPFH